MRFLQTLSFIVGLVTAKLITNDTGTTFAVQNDRLSLELTKSSGKILKMSLDGWDLLAGGPGLYLDCYCIPSGFYTIGSSGVTNSTLVTGTDSTGTAYAGLIVSDVYPPTGQGFQQFWFLRDGETGLHAFSRLYYYNETKPFLRNLQELRTMFRPAANHFTYLTSSDHTWAPLPSANATASWPVAQDATWYVGNAPTDRYFSEFADYFTKYTFANSYKDQKAHGMFIDGAETGGIGYGAWLVMNTKETYFGGPLHSDLLVDGIVYDYISSNHHGDDNPNITNGFDRTFGPKFYYFNAIEGAGHEELRQDAEKYADPTWNAAFYDTIAPYVANYVPTSNRGTFEAVVSLPPGAKNPLAILTVSGYGHQDNSFVPSSFQYWANVTNAGTVKIPRVVAGKYRLSIFADGVFGDYVQDNIEIVGGNTKKVAVNWKAESAGTEIWRVGTPDKSSGEFKRGNVWDTTKSRHPEQYRVYWGKYNYTADFPNPVRFKIGESKEAEDLNYVHWSVYGPTYKDPNIYVLNNNWTIAFDIKKRQIPARKDSIATFTIQLAGVKTASGNTDVTNGAYSNFTLSTFVNNNAPLEWNIQWFQSSSCAVRSAVVCYNIANKFTFPTSWLKEGENELVLSIPYNATDVETAVLPGSIYVQYDALRLEIA
ncbi:galactose mutarotase-like domain-containing protein [Flagelloscypha sp. PMI_526]|nr:galactose mutarotase-like domain-containing protein [Flagelloscypha sp. PMI_526]